MAGRISKESFADEVLASKGLVLVDFYSDSCVPCKRLSPVLAELEDNGIAVFKVNTAYDTELCEEYGVLSAPTVIFFRDGAEAGRTVGFKSRTELEALINELR